MKNLILKNGIILTPFVELKDRVLFLKNGRIYKLISNAEYLNYSKDYLTNYKIIDLKGNYISPGFIDIHIHGSNGVDAVKDDIGPMADFLVKYGVTGFLPTLITAEFTKMINACKKISYFIKDQRNGSKVLGINAEGPYLSKKYGAQKPELVKKPEFKEYSKLIEACNGNLKIMTVAPELENAYELIKYLRQNDVVVSIGHTDIKFEKLHEALDLGIGLVTHIFNAMGGVLVAEEGVKSVSIQEELLACDNLMSEVICDKNAVHVNPTLMKVLVKCKGINNIILITDSMSMNGLSYGKHYLQDGRAAITKKDEDVVRLENGGLAGSIMTINNAIKNIMLHANLSLKDAIIMATYNPAKILKLSNKKGAIKEGMDADITVFDNLMDIKITIIEGEIKYNNL